MFAACLPSSSTSTEHYNHQTEHSTLKFHPKRDENGKQNKLPSIYQ